LVVGALGGRDISETLSALKVDEFEMVVCCTAPSPRARSGREIAAVATQMGCTNVISAESVEKGCEIALADADSDDAILVTGSLYVVGSARTFLRRVLP
jgi:folylpolyglutamate synthase/dihydropteroate synthase